MMKSKLSIAKLKAKAVAVASPAEGVRTLRAAKINGIPKIVSPAEFIAEGEAVRAQAALDATLQGKPALTMAPDVQERLKADIAKHVGTKAAKAVLEGAKLTPVERAAHQAALKQPTGKPTVIDELATAEPLSIPLKFLAAALEIAPKKDVRRDYLCGVHVHQLPDGQTRVVATEGHRLLVMNLPTTARVEWAQGPGITLPTEMLNRIIRYFGKDGEVTVNFGVGYPAVEITQVGDFATFRVSVDAESSGRFPDYQKIMLSSADVLTSERVALESTQINPDYLKSAGVIANKLEASGVMPFISGDAKATTMFTFVGAPEAVLYVSPMGQPAECIPDSTARMLGSDTVDATIARLRAQEKISRENAKRTKIAKFAEQSTAKAEKIAARIARLQAAIAPQIEAPKAPAADVVKH